MPSGWRVRVVAESPPLFHIEGEFFKKAAGLCDRMEAIGAHEVVIESPDHNTEFEVLGIRQIVDVLEVLKERARDLGKDPRLRQVLISKIRKSDGDIPYTPAGGDPGSADMQAAGPAAAGSDGAGSGGTESGHPKWHIISTPFVPAQMKDELKGSARYFSYKERCVFCDYISQEKKAASRIICQNEHAVAVSPYAACLPYEAWLLPLSHLPDFGGAASEDIEGIAPILKRLAGAMMKIEGSRGYIIEVHTAPFRKPRPGAWKTIDQDYHWHLKVRPRLKVLNGLKETGRFNLNPILPEDAAGTLAALCPDRP
jgi:UDPglucose--hexose-1-phosphate uridylyltransferase